MAYSADTFVADEQPTTAKWNKLWSNDASFNDGTGIGDDAIIARHIADDVVSMYQHTDFSGCELSKSAAQSLTNSALTPITFDTEVLDTDGYHSTSSNTSRITIPKAGIYLFHGNITFAPNTTGSRFAWIQLNGVDSRHGLNGGMDPEGDDCGLSVVTLQSLSASDYVELYGFQSSGGALNVQAENDKIGYTRFGVVRLGS